MEKDESLQLLNLSNMSYTDYNEIQPSDSILHETNMNVLTPRKSLLKKQREMVQKYMSTPHEEPTTLKKRKISFGKKLTPEYFDKELPANTPLKKGTRPEIVPKNACEELSQYLTEESNSATIDISANSTLFNSNTYSIPCSSYLEITKYTNSTFNDSTVMISFDDTNELDSKQKLVRDTFKMNTPQYMFNNKSELDVYCHLPSPQLNMFLKPQNINVLQNDSDNIIGSDGNLPSNVLQENFVSSTHITEQIKFIDDNDETNLSSIKKCKRRSYRNLNSSASSIKQVNDQLKNECTPRLITDKLNSSLIPKPSPMFRKLFQYNNGGTLSPKTCDQFLQISKSEKPSKIPKSGVNVGKGVVRHRNFSNVGQTQLLYDNFTSKIEYPTEISFKDSTANKPRKHTPTRNSIIDDLPKSDDSLNKSAPQSKEKYFKVLPEPFDSDLTCIVSETPAINTKECTLNTDSSEGKKSKIGGKVTLALRKKIIAKSLKSRHIRSTKKAITPKKIAKKLIKTSNKILRNKPQKRTIKEKKGAEVPKPPKIEKRNQRSSKMIEEKSNSFNCQNSELEIPPRVTRARSFESLILTNDILLPKITFSNEDGSHTATTQDGTFNGCISSNPLGSEQNKRISHDYTEKYNDNYADTFTQIFKTPVTYKKRKSSSEKISHRNLDSKRFTSFNSPAITDILDEKCKDLISVSSPGDLFDNVPLEAENMLKPSLDETFNDTNCETGHNHLPIVVSPIQEKRLTNTLRRSNRKRSISAVKADDKLSLLAPIATEDEGYDRLYTSLTPTKNEINNEEDKSEFLVDNEVKYLLDQSLINCIMGINMSEKTTSKIGGKDTLALREKTIAKSLKSRHIRGNKKALTPKNIAKKLIKTSNKILRKKPQKRTIKGKFNKCVSSNPKSYGNKRISQDYTEEYNDNYADTFTQIFRTPATYKKRKSSSNKISHHNVDSDKLSLLAPATEDDDGHYPLTPTKNEVYVDNEVESMIDQSLNSINCDQKLRRSKRKQSFEADDKSSLLAPATDDEANGQYPLTPTMSEMYEGKRNSLVDNKVESSLDQSLNGINCDQQLRRLKKKQSFKADDRSSLLAPATDDDAYGQYSLTPTMNKMYEGKRKSLVGNKVKKSLDQSINDMNCHQQMRRSKKKQSFKADDKSSLLAPATDDEAYGQYPLTPTMSEMYKGKIKSLSENEIKSVLGQSLNGINCDQKSRRSKKKQSFKADDKSSSLAEMYEGERGSLVDNKAESSLDQSINDVNCDQKLGRSKKERSFKADDKLSLLAFATDDEDYGHYPITTADDNVISNEVITNKSLVESEVNHELIDVNQSCPTTVKRHNRRISRAESRKSVQIEKRKLRINNQTTDVDMKLSVKSVKKRTVAIKPLSLKIKPGIKADDKLSSLASTTVNKDYELYSLIPNKNEIISNVEVKSKSLMENEPKSLLDKSFNVLNRETRPDHISTVSSIREKRVTGMRGSKKKRSAKVVKAENKLSSLPPVTIDESYEPTPSGAEFIHKRQIKSKILLKNEVNHDLTDVNQDRPTIDKRLIKRGNVKPKKVTVIKKRKSRINNQATDDGEMKITTSPLATEKPTKRPVTVKLPALKRKHDQVALGNTLAKEKKEKNSIVINRRTNIAAVMSGKTSSIDTLPKTDPDKILNRQSIECKPRLRNLKTVKDVVETEPKNFVELPPSKRNKIIKTKTNNKIIDLLLPAEITNIENNIPPMSSEISITQRAEIVPVKLKSLKVAPPTLTDQKRSGGRVKTKMIVNKQVQVPTNVCRRITRKSTGIIDCPIPIVVDTIHIAPTPPSINNNNNLKKRKNLKTLPSNQIAGTLDGPDEGNVSNKKTTKTQIPTNTKKFYENALETKISNKSINTLEANEITHAIEKVLAPKSQKVAKKNTRVIKPYQKIVKTSPRQLRKSSRFAICDEAENDLKTHLENNNNCAKRGGKSVKFDLTEVIHEITNEHIEYDEISSESPITQLNLKGNYGPPKTKSKRGKGAQLQLSELVASAKSKRSNKTKLITQNEDILSVAVPIHVVSAGVSKKSKSNIPPRKSKSVKSLNPRVVPINVGNMRITRSRTTTMK